MNRIFFVDYFLMAGVKDADFRYRRAILFFQVSLKFQARNWSNLREEGKYFLCII